MSKTLVIAEAGVNHDGNLSTAKELIDVAADCGADLVKFQTFIAEDLVTMDAMTAKYQKDTENNSESQYQLLKKLELSQANHVELVAHSRARGIEFFSTAFDFNSIDFLAELGQKKFKVPSGEITNVPYLRHIASFGFPIIMSTGMANLDEIEIAIHTIEKAGTQRDMITLMHCTSAYPAPMKDLNLTAIVKMREIFRIPVGYSDHSIGIEASIAATALGATVIEKHFTLSKDRSGPDHRTSLEPHELKKMIEAIRNLDLALGDGTKALTDSERENVDVVRKSIVACCAINKGDIFTVANLTTKRPGTGLSPLLWDELIGSHATQNYDVNDLISR